MSDEVEIEVCCDALKEAIEGGGIEVIEMPKGGFAEVISYEDGETAVKINYCPFCGASRPDEQVLKRVV
jgi:hypothetical protein